MKQTAVEWLYEQILLTPLDIRSINKCLEQAKEMEKGQMIDFADNYELECIHPYKGRLKNPEQYYNETFKSEK
jgi:hypothetical protein